MTKRFLVLFFLATLCLGCSTELMAQVTTVGRIIGTVTDQTGAVVAGADVKVRDQATGFVIETKSTGDGHFTAANLQPGFYTVNVTAKGFKAAEFRDVKLVVGQTYDLDVKLEVGAVESTIVVEAGAEVLDTASTTIGASIMGKSITQLPFTSRDALDLAALMPGAQTTGRTRQTSFDGLPKGAINITYDGINAQDNLLKSSDGFFTTIRPRVDVVEEFSISTATQGADQSGEGAIQIRFETKRGGNEYHGGVWWYHRNDWLNANYYFSNQAGQPRQRVRLNQFGYKVGGPIWKDKVFFFTAFDWWRKPDAILRTRWLPNLTALNGTFTYVTSSTITTTAGSPLPSWMNCGGSYTPGYVGSIPSGTTCQAMLIGTGSLASANSLPNAVDSLVATTIVNPLISAFAAPGVTVGTGPAASLAALSFNNRNFGKRYFPDVRFDWNVTKTHQITGIYHFSVFKSPVDTLNSRDRTYPVAPFDINQAPQNSNRNQFTGAWRWTIGSNKSNELRFGVVSAPTWFFLGQPLSPYPQFTTNLGNTRVRPSPSTAIFPTNAGAPSVPYLGFSPAPRNTALAQLIETFSWTRGKHSMSFGYTQTHLRGGQTSYDSMVGTLNLGLDATDPAYGAITGGIMGSSSTDQGRARALYGMLAGRVNGFSQSVYLDTKTRQFVTNAPLQERYRQNEFGIYGTDSWRVLSTVTLNFGLRWEYQGSPYDVNNVYFKAVGGDAAVYGVSGRGNLFKPGTLTGTVPAVALHGPGGWYPRDLNNFAPSFGLAWQPDFDNKWWNRIFGGPGKTVVRGGYSISYTREGTANFTSISAGNPGFSGVQNLTPLAPGQPSYPAGYFAAGSIAYSGAALSNVLQTPSAFTSTFSLTPFQGQSINAFSDNLRTPYVQSWSFGIQREISPSTVVEIRYVGNHSVGLWRQVNINEINIFENGFLTEYGVAANNLAICLKPANLTACRTGSGYTGSASAFRGSFANLGLTDPTLGAQGNVVILTSAFTGNSTITPASQRNSGFFNSAFVAQLQNSIPGAMANSLATSATYYFNLIAATNPSTGTPYPTNFWRVNPDATSGAWLMTNLGQSTYNALQVELRRRPARGLQFNANYTFSKSLTNYFGDSSGSAAGFDTARDLRRNKGISPWNLTHAFKLNAIYELPFGSGRKWSSSYGWLNQLIGGWELSTIARIQSGRVFRLDSGLGGTFNQYDPGVQLIGITPSQIQSSMTIRKLPDGRVYWFPASLLDSSQNTANFSYIKSCQTPGQWCQKVFLTGPKFFRADISILKRTKISERINLEIRGEFLNAFNNINFFYPGGESTSVPTADVQGSSDSLGRIRNAYRDFSTTDDPGGRIIQLVLRVNF